jgi:hypothetical protein
MKSIRKHRSRFEPLVRLEREPNLPYAPANQRGVTQITANATHWILSSFDSCYCA